VFDCFCDPRAFITWMGDNAELEPRAGGAFAVDINGVLVRGRYEVVDRPNRLVFSWGMLGSQDMPPGSTSVEVILTPSGEATDLTLRHHNLPPDQLELHGVGWGHFLGRLAVAATGQDPGPDPWAAAPPPAGDNAR
jgi:uncharacterized protein YndB with AHSA1/START domain